MRRGDPAKPGSAFIVVEHPEQPHLCLQQGDAFRFADTPADKVERVEVLGRGRQSVILGMHPCGEPFRWDRGRSILELSVEDLPTITLDELEAFVSACNAALEGAGGVRCGRGSRQLGGAEETQSADLTPLRGPQGAGKTTLTELLRGIFHPAHVVSADRPEALLGKFNAHLREALVVVADEAVFAGDMAANNRLKAFVTDSTITVEQKGIDSVSVPSFHRLVMTSNEDHVIRAETDARRWAVFDVSGERVGDAAYFRELHSALKSQHPEMRAFLRDLAGMKVDEAAVRRAPTTGGLIGQIVQSLPAPQQWLYEILRDSLPASDLLTPQSAAAVVPHVPAFGDGDGEWPAYATREAMSRSFDTWASGRRYLRGNNTNALGNLLKLFGAAVQVRGADGSRRRVVRLGTLAEARAAFAAAYLRGVGDASVWGDEDEQAMGDGVLDTAGTGLAPNGTVSTIR